MSIKLSCIALDISKTLEGTKLLVEPPRVYKGVRDGIKTGPEGLAYTCLCAGLNFEKQVIKVPGTLHSPINYDGTPIEVEFSGLEGKMWQDFNNRGEIKLTVTAKGIVAANEKPKLQINTGGEKA